MHLVYFLARYQSRLNLQTQTQICHGMFDQEIGAQLDYRLDHRLVYPLEYFLPYREAWPCQSDAERIKGEESAQAI